MMMLQAAFMKPMVSFGDGISSLLLSTLEFLSGRVRPAADVLTPYEEAAEMRPLTNWETLFSASTQFWGMLEDDEFCGGGVDMINFFSLAWIVFFTKKKRTLYVSMR